LSERAECLLDHLMHILLSECLCGRLDTLILLRRDELAHVFGPVTTVRTCHGGVVRKRLPLLGLQLEEPLASRTLAAEESFFIRRNRDRGFKAPVGLSHSGDTLWKSMLPVHAIIQASLRLERGEEPDVSLIY
jgi:hypothetical protein